MDWKAQRARLSALIDEAGLSDRAADILGVARQSLRLFSEDLTEATSAVGASRWGGAADLPSPEAWPSHAGQPLTFIAQIRLEEVAGLLTDNPLPAAGLLSLFTMDLVFGDEEPSDEVYEAYGSVGAALYHESIDDLQSVEPPYGEDARVITCRAIRFERELCLPPVEGPDIAPLGLEGEAFDAYWEPLWMKRLVTEDEPFHRLLGHPDMNYNHHMKGTRLLFQLGADDDIGWEFGDAQDLRWLIEPDALAAADFTRMRCNGDLE